MTFVRIDGDGEAIPISDKVRSKYNNLESKNLQASHDDEMYEIYGGE